MARRGGKIKYAKKTLSWVLKRKFLSCCIAVLIVFAFIGKCSKNDYAFRSPQEISYLKILKGKYSGFGRKVDVAAAEAAIGQACSFIASAEDGTEGWDTPDARDLLLATAVAESDLRARFQDAGGDAIGLFQIEYGTYRDLWRRAIRYKHPKLYKAMRQHFGDAQTGDVKFEDLQRNDVVGAIFARVKYFESGGKIPPASDIDAQAKFYKEIYNTASGKADVEIFKKKKTAIIRKTR